MPGIAAARRCSTDDVVSENSVLSVSMQALGQGEGP
jgi:hypothetical protein